jgi:subtilase family protein
MIVPMPEASTTARRSLATISQRDPTRPLACRLIPLVGAALLILLLPPAARSQTFVWDNDDDHIDDRIETVHAAGFHFSFEEGDSLLRQRIEVEDGAGGNLFYGLYVVYDHHPTDQDAAALGALGMPVLQRYHNVPAVRSVGSFVQVQQVVALPGVVRVEAIPLAYPVDRIGAATIGARDPSEQVFPTASGVGAPQGEGVVVAILDTGINDETDGSYPGHESLVGRFLGGGIFAGNDSTLDTPKEGSVNPVDRGGEATRRHGTHVAGIVLGNGGSSGYAPGVAPEARFLDLKVLNDAGVGTAVAEALDWCIHNRTRDWGAGATWRGIDVINLSISSLDRSDGNDVAARLAARAVELGMVVVASVGNESQSAYIPSPAAGDGVLAIGAVDDQRTARNQDDVWASFNDYGPRDGDGDADAADEQKPDLLAPGVAVLSADGDLSSDGAQYQRLTGTSMSVAYVSGAVAVLRSAYPAKNPRQIAELLRSTAVRTLTSPGTATGTDPRWRSGIGYGVIDLYAAWLEARQPARSQVRRLMLSATDTQISATLWTQRELGAQHFVFERAPDDGGSPGTFAAYDSVAAAGDGSLLDVANLTSYSRSWPVPADERGAPFWYRVAYTEAGARFISPAARFTGPVGPPAATLEVVVVHNAYDNDVDAEIVLGDPSLFGPGNRGASPISFPLPASSAAISSDWATGVSTTGNVAWKFRIKVPAGVADAYLPPTTEQPWWLAVAEDGYLNRHGRVVSYKLTWHSPQGDQVYEGGPVPRWTVEGQTVWLSAPQTLVGVEPSLQAGALRYGPNPVAAGQTIRFALGSGPIEDLHVFDVTGREVARVTPLAAGGGYQARWEARDGSGSPLPSGLYFARIAGRNVARMVVVAR